MAKNEGGVTFINCVGSDISLWKKNSYNINFEWETCILYDEPEYHLDENADNTIWKFYDHITKRYLLGNGKKIFHYTKYENQEIKVEITTPLYPLKELCTYTIVRRLFKNKNEAAIEEFDIPKELKVDLKTCYQQLDEIYDDDESLYFSSEEENYQPFKI